MPQPSFNQVHLAAALTQIATAYIQSNDVYVADKVFPYVPVQHQTDKYFIFSKDDFFRDQAQLRADATETAGGGFSLTTGSYSAKVYGFHKDIGEQTRSNADPAVDIEMATTRFIMQSLMIKRERDFVSTYLKTGLWGTDITGVASGPTASQTVFWNDDGNGDPISDIATGQTAILQNTGYEANTLLVTWPVYQALRKHPLVIDRIKYTSPVYAGTITPALLAELFDVDRVLVSKAVYNSAAEGLTGSYSFVAGKNALLCHAAPAPGLMIPSAGYIFPWANFTGQNSIGVRINTIPVPLLGQGTVRVEGEMAYDMQAIGTDLGYYFSSIVQ